MSGEALIAPILRMIETDAYTDLFMRSGVETRVKTPRGWMPISSFAKGARPQPPTQEWLTGFVADMCGRNNWLDEMLESKSGMAFMFPFDERQLRLRCKVALCAPPSAGKPPDFTVNVRNLPVVVPTLLDLGLPLGLTQMLSPAGGLVIVTGQICSGKTTTLASLIRSINESRHANIITLEHLQEYIHTPEKSIVTQRTVPDAVPSFLQGIHDALDGQAVDVMMIGEVVDKPTMEALFRMAESGHLVLATLHAGNAVGAISRIVGMFPGEERAARLEMLADKLVGVVAQRLLPHTNQEKYVLAYEVLRNSTPAVANAIKENNLVELQNQMQQGGAQGMVTLNQILAKLVKEKQVERNVALSVTYARSDLEQLVPRS